MGKLRHRGAARMNVQEALSSQPRGCAPSCSVTCSALGLWGSPRANGWTPRPWGPSVCRVWGLRAHSSGWGETDGADLGKRRLGKLPRGSGAMGPTLAPGRLALGAWPRRSPAVPWASLAASVKWENSQPCFGEGMCIVLRTGPGTDQAAPGEITDIQWLCIWRALLR